MPAFRLSSGVPFGLHVQKLMHDPSGAQRSHLDACTQCLHAVVPSTRNTSSYNSLA